jgi:hypothetical protein
MRLGFPLNGLSCGMRIVGLLGEALASGGSAWLGAGLFRGARFGNWRRIHDERDRESNVCEVLKITKNS